MQYVRYLRDEKRMPYGVVMGISPDYIGWALCNTECEADRAALARGGKKELKRRAAFRMVVAGEWRKEFHRGLVARQTRRAFLLAELARAYFWLVAYQEEALKGAESETA